MNGTPIPNTNVTMMPHQLETYREHLVLYTNAYFLKPAICAYQNSRDCQRKTAVEDAPHRIIRIDSTSQYEDADLLLYTGYYSFVF